ncbi:MAG: topoisomerase DNA-binding C4 zinc finger domain-containing protein [Clostridia bacterium]|nr:topoisomerase DNA-binding C4 zinc finger domain-containing protein [Clostridia bacterium]
MKSKGGKDFYGCSDFPNCKFMSLDEPTGENCPKCGKPLVYDKNRNIKCSAKDCAYSPIGQEEK